MKPRDLAVFFVGRPTVPWRWIVAVALSLAVVKFPLLFAGMAAGLPAGVSALVLQSQAVFTAVFAVGAVAYIAVLATLFGFGAWGTLMRRYGAATVAPFAMLAPVFALASSAVLLGEEVGWTQVVGGSAVLAGVLLGAVPVRVGGATGRFRAWT